MGEPSKVLLRLGGVLDVTGEVVAMWIILAVLAVISLILRSRLRERPGCFKT